MTDIIIGGILSLFSILIFLYFIKWNFNIIILKSKGFYTKGKVIRFETAGKYDKKWWMLEHRATPKDELESQWESRRHNEEIFPIVQVKELNKEIKLRVDTQCELEEEFTIYIDPSNTNRFYAPKKEKNGIIILIFASIFLGSFGYHLIKEELNFTFKYNFINENNLMFCIGLVLVILGITSAFITESMKE